MRGKNGACSEYSPSAVCERHVGLPEAVPLQTLVRDKPAQEGRRCRQLQAAIWKEVCDEGCLRLHVVTANIRNRPLADHRHRLLAWQCLPCSWHASEAKPGPYQSLYSAMVSLNDIIDVFALSETCNAPRFAPTFHLARGTRAGWVLVHG